MRAAFGWLGKLRLAVFDAQAVEADALVGVEDGSFPEHGLEASVHEVSGRWVCVCGCGEWLPHAAKGVFDLDLAQGLIGVGANFLEQLPLLWDDLFECGFPVGLGGRVCTA